MTVAQLSLEARLAKLDPVTRLQVLSEVFEVIDPGALAYSWDYQGRPSQLEATNSDAHKTLVLAGRGFGKTRIGSEWVRRMTRGAPTRGFLAARTASDVRDTLIQGESGLLNIFPPSEMPRWVASQRTVYFANGSSALCLSSKEPDQARGPQAHWALCDEWATWAFSKNEEVLDLWTNIQIATRLGDGPGNIMLTTTPKRIKQVREMVAAAKLGNQGVKLVTGSTFENVALSGEYLDTMVHLYGGTKLGLQELFAQVLDDIEGALWSEAQMLALHELAPNDLPLKVVAVDPSVADEPKDECGIVVCAATGEAQPMKRRGWVLDDRSGIMPPAKWAKVVVDTANEYGATVIAESNQGGAMVREMIHNIDPKLRVRLVHAKESKKLRAEPVSAVYEQRRVFHTERFPDLENQMTGWVPGESKDSPDRVDAMVHGFTALLLPAGRGAVAGQSTISNPNRSGVRVPTGLRSGPRAAGSRPSLGLGSRRR